MKKADIGRLLPEVLQDCLTDGDSLTPGCKTLLSPLDTLLGLAEIFTEPIENAFGQLDLCFRPHECERRFLPFLATWLNMERFVHLLNSSFSEALADHRARQLVAQGAELARDRGTSAGIITFLELATGVQGFRVEENRTRYGEVLPFQVTIVCPSPTHRLENLIEEVVRRQKPAYLCCNIVFEEAVTGV